MFIPYQRIYSGSRIDRPLTGLVFFKVPRPDTIIKKITISFLTPTEIGEPIFNVSLAGVDLFAGEDKPKIVAGTSFVIIDDLEVETELGQLVSLDVVDPGVGGIPGTVFFEVEFEDAQETAGTDGVDGVDGVDGTDGIGVPSGGTTGQVLKKASGTNYDTEWDDESGGGGGSLPTGGSTGQVLTKQSGTDGDADWETPSGGGGGTVGLFSPDVPYGTPSAYDDEFDTGTLDGKWTPLYTFTESFVIPSHLRLINNTSSTTYRTIRQAAPAAQDSEWIIKVIMGKHESIQSICGIEMRIADRGGYRKNVVFFGNSSGGNVRVYDTSNDAMDTNIQDKALGFSQTGQMGTLYLRCKYIHSTHVIEFRCSTDGITWLSLSDWSTAGYDLTDVGVIWCGSGTLAGNWSEIDFFRKWQGSYVGGMY